MRCVGRSERQIGKKRSVWANTFAVVDHSQQLANQILAQVVPLRGCARRIDVVVVNHQLRMKLVGLTFKKSIETIKAARQWPLIERAGCRNIVGWSQMPFPCAKGRIAFRFQYFRQSCRVI